MENLQKQMSPLFFKFCLYDTEAIRYLNLTLEDL
jgi:hypothetical protein